MSEKNKIVTYQKIRMLFNTTNPIIVLSLICAIGLLIRVYYFPHNIPITLDGSVYFWYAIDMSLLGDFPHGFDFPNNGWPSFLSLFFAVMKSENFLDFMYMQRLLTMTISTLTAIPIYLLGTRFFEKHYALIGVGIFVLEPRIIINSLLGITEPSFIFIVVLVLFFILGKSIKSTYIAFGLTALAALTRYEGLLLCIPISIVYFLRFGRKKRDVIRYFIALAIFVLILSPMVYERIRTMGDDGLVSHVTHAAKIHQIIAERENLSTSYYGEVFQTTIISFILYLGWIMIPIFAFFVPLACIVFVRNEFHKIKDSRVITLILFVVTMSLPAIYAYSRDIQETRYLYVFFPVFCLLSVFTIKKVSNKLIRPRFFIIMLFIGIIITSLIFIDAKGIDTKHQSEAFVLAIKISKVTKGINPYSEDGYIKASWAYNEKFPTLSSSITRVPSLILYNDTTTYNEYLKEGKKNGLTHIVTDGLFNPRSDIGNSLNDIFVHESNYPYLKKIYDSSQEDYSYHIKIFEVSYDILETMNK